ncbi:putative ABC transporter ATP-binding protein YlmA [Pseudobythopirellula maris]|uniref:Putative ABC transporter ATP-binding protein YlmA n=1 Tax=Pseudobythopirellula maris TaxID=2527991 RepID=A0A5C5ZL41_9BACT|nr:ATP-binding cassette domain-containing protein [Pseudobythopirellula maris]TWT88154.1 putative ABC transporter ATP-binding protein YlmA [Pseudobythopirellula maris]
MPEPPLIELQGVGFRRAGADILAGVNWRLQRSRHTAVLGPNGAGKTTLLRLACGYAWPTAGRVLRLGRELVDLRALRRQIGWIASDLAAQVPPRDSGLETVVSGRYGQVGLRRHLKPAPTEADFADARKELAALRCDALTDKPFGVMSHGERQQVLIARARMAAPLLLVLDEPCAGMDPGVRERFLAWLEERLAVGAGPTVVLVTHHVEEITPSIARTVVVSGGRLTHDGPTSEVVTAETINEVYGTKVRRLEREAGRCWAIW